MAQKGWLIEAEQGPTSRGVSRLCRTWPGRSEKDRGIVSQPMM